MQPENVTRWPILGAACAGVTCPGVTPPSMTGPSATSPSAIAIALIPCPPWLIPRRMTTHHPSENATVRAEKLGALERNFVVHVAALAAGADGGRLARLGAGGAEITAPARLGAEIAAPAQ